MRKIIFWAVNVIIFALLFIFSLKNLDNITLKFVGTQWDIPLIVLILIVFAVGCFVGAFAMLPFIWNQRKKNKKTIQQERENNADKLQSNQIKVV